MTKLSVNINKFATIRNARGGNNPNLIQVAKDCESFGAQGITIHPRPDERHIRRIDALEISKVVRTEFNIEGYPSDDFMDLMEEIKPAQVTLVPDSPEVLTSDSGWDCIRNEKALSLWVEKLRKSGIRTSLFIDPDSDQIKAAGQTGTDRIELYTESYARSYKNNRAAAVKPYSLASETAAKLGIGLNAGHDLDLINLRYFMENTVELLEVSIGHALVCDALYLGLHNTIVAYLNALHPDFL